ncbi:MAG: hypothetical protein PCFJNLEI_02207 [Verrucomicrobiae bacterium]|nr:hypothetical protein [Verrucomicrobiae bacterium]
MLALLWLFLIVLPVLVIMAVATPEAFTLTLSWHERPVVETQSRPLVALFIGVPCFALWLGVICAYRVFARIREVDGVCFFRAILRGALVGFTGALVLVSTLLLIYKHVGIPGSVVLGFLTPGMACWLLLVSVIPGLSSLVQSTRSVACVSVLFSAVCFSVVASCVAALHLRLRRTTPNV